MSRLTAFFLKPIEKAVEHNKSVTANTNILAADLTPTDPPTLFRTMIAFNAAGVFKAIITRDATSVTAEFNAGATLAANSLYIFDMLVHDGDKVNFQYSVSATMLVMRVQEIGLATQ